jgi:hypothetical protein
MYFYNNTYAEHHSGTSQGGVTNLQIKLATEANSTTSNYYTGWEVKITNNIPQGVQGLTRSITAYAEGTGIATVEDWGFNLTNETKYKLYQVAQAGTNRTITLQNHSTVLTTDNYYNGWQIIIQNDTPVGIINTKRIIEKYDGTNKIATVTEDWTSNPISGTGYILYETTSVIDHSKNFIDLSSSNVTASLDDNTLIFDSFNSGGYIREQRATETADITGGSTSTIKLENDSGTGKDTADYFNTRWYIKLLSTAGDVANGDLHQIINYDQTTRVATIGSTWSGSYTPVSNETTYYLVQLDEIVPSTLGNTSQIKLDTTDNGGILTGKDKENYFAGMYIKIITGSGGSDGDIRQIIEYDYLTNVATVDSAWTGGNIAANATYRLMEPRKYISLNQSNPDYYGIYTTNETDSHVIPFDTPADGANTKKILHTDVSTKTVSGTNEALRIRIGDTKSGQEKGGFVIEGYNATTDTTTDLMVVNTDGTLHTKDVFILPEGANATSIVDGSIRLKDASTSLEVYHSAMWNDVPAATEEFVLPGYIKGMEISYVDTTHIKITAGILHFYDGVTSEMVTMVEDTNFEVFTGTPGTNVVYSIYVKKTGTTYSFDTDTTEYTYNDDHYGYYDTTGDIRRVIGYVVVLDTNVIKDFYTSGAEDRIIYNYKTSGYSIRTTGDGNIGAMNTGTLKILTTNLPKSVAEVFFTGELTGSANDVHFGIATKAVGNTNSANFIKVRHTKGTIARLHGSLLNDDVSTSGTDRNFYLLAGTSGTVTGNIYVPGFSYYR